MRYSSLKYILISIFASAICSCGIDDPEIQGTAVSLKAGVGYAPALGVHTKASAPFNGVMEPATILPSNLPIGVLRIDQTEYDYGQQGTSRFNFTAANIKDGANVDISSYHSSVANGNPHMYHTSAEMSNNPDGAYLRDISNFGKLQFYLNTTDYIHYYGWYPYGTMGAGKDGRLASTSPIDMKTDVLYSGIATGKMNTETETLVFHHALAQYRVWVYKMNVESDWDKIDDITVKDAQTSVRMTLPFKEGDIEYSGSSDISLATALSGCDKENNRVFYDQDATIPLGYSNRANVAAFLAAPPEDDMLQLHFRTNDKGNDKHTEKTLYIANDFEAGYAYDIILCFSDHGYINAEVSVMPWIHATDVTVDVNAKMFYDLSRYETANTYIVSSSNMGYCFNGTVKGCGDKLGGGKIVGVSDVSLPEDVYLDIAYTSSADLITLVSHRLVNNMVLFEVPGEDGTITNNPYKLKTEGNVIITAYQDVSKKRALWSWHIWMTDHPQEQGYENGYTMLDRNLGALSPGKDDNSSFYYQWGRKDPMIPGYTTVYSDQTTAANAAPDGFYGAGLASWTTENISKFWGYTDKYTEYVKTIYDPCPAGYRVPERRSWVKMGYTSVNADGYHFYGGTTVWYPQAGYGSYDAQQNGAKFTKSGTNQSAYTSDYIGTPYYWSASASGAGSASQINATNALPVRCVSTSSDPVVVNLSEEQTANCYIVSESGVYEFNATVRGNGKQTVVDAVVNENDPNISGLAEVGILWWQGDLNGSNNTAGTDCPIIMLKPNAKGNSVPDADGYVSFEIENWSKGNAILAGRNANGVILWTWHIWLTEKPKNISGQRNEYAYVTMDRNLGATYSPTAYSDIQNNNNRRIATYGFFYQWGRKDPFPGPGAVSSNTNSTWYLRDMNSGTWTRKTNITVETSVTNRVEVTSTPLSFKKWNANNTSNFSKYSWFSTYPTVAGLNGMWGYGEKTTGSTNLANMTKTMNDPCPPGYLMPPHGFFAAFGMNSAANGNSKDMNFTKNGTYGFWATQTAFAGNGATVTEDIWFPCAGRINGETGAIDNVGSRGWFWSGLPYATENDGTSRVFVVDISGTNVSTGQERDGNRRLAHGYTIRCLAE